MSTRVNLGDAWKECVESFGSHIAFETESGSWTFFDIDRISDYIRRHMEAQKCHVGDVVAILHTKELTSYALMVACLKGGIIYTCIDVTSPIARLAKIIESCQPKLIVSDSLVTEELVQFFDDQNLAVWNLGDEDVHSVDVKPYETHKALTWSSPAYIMFTSGSTGTPKGVTITHGGLLGLIDWGRDYFGITTSDKFAQLSPMYFDNSVFDFYVGLFNGACLVPVRAETVRNPQLLIQYVESFSCTVWFSVPSLIVYLLTMKALNKYSFPSLRIITFGGEGFPKSELKKLHAYLSPRCRLINVYGPTEGTCICSAHRVTDETFDDMQSLAPLGAINPNFDYLILDPEGKEVAEGKKGELCLSGPNISLGYFNDQKRTAEQFIQNPLNDKYREIIYKTGDLVFESGGKLHFSGRIDNQIKHMGYRIELEEIESALNSIDHIQQVGVVYHRQRVQHGRILAFVQSETAFDESDLRVKLAELLPDYMLPSQFIFVNRLPKNANGKVDRGKLLAKFVS